MIPSIVIFYLSVIMGRITSVIKSGLRYEQLKNSTRTVMFAADFFSTNLKREGSQSEGVAQHEDADDRPQDQHWLLVSPPNHALTPGAGSGCKLTASRRMASNGAAVAAVRVAAAPRAGDGRGPVEVARPEEAVPTSAVSRRRRSEAVMKAVNTGDRASVCRGGPEDERRRRCISTENLSAFEYRTFFSSPRLLFLSISQHLFAKDLYKSFFYLQRKPVCKLTYIMLSGNVLKRVRSSSYCSYENKLYIDRPLVLLGHTSSYLVYVCTLNGPRRKISRSFASRK